MYLITDTFISSDSFIEVPNDPGMIAFRCKPENLVNAHLNLMEWARQLKAEIEARGLTTLV